MALLRLLLEAKALAALASAHARFRDRQRSRAAPFPSSWPVENRSSLPAARARAHIREGFRDRAHRRRTCCCCLSEASQAVGRSDPGPAQAAACCCCSLALSVWVCVFARLSDNTVSRRVAGSKRIAAYCGCVAALPLTTPRLCTQVVFRRFAVRRAGPWGAGLIREKGEGRGRPAGRRARRDALPSLPTGREAFSPCMGTRRNPARGADGAPRRPARWLERRRVGLARFGRFPAPRTK